jgi:glutamyl-tRNA reductase
VVDLDALGTLAAANRARRAVAAEQAEALVEARLEALERRLARRRTELLLGEALAESGERLEHELRALTTGRLAHLEARDREAVVRWARATFGRLAHGPVQTAKRLAAQHPELHEEDEEETTG